MVIYGTVGTSLGKKRPLYSREQLCKSSKARPLEQHAQGLMMQFQNKSAGAGYVSPQTCYGIVTWPFFCSCSPRCVPSAVCSRPQLTSQNTALLISPACLHPPPFPATLAIGLQSNRYDTSVHVRLTFNFVHTHTHTGYFSLYYDTPQAWSAVRQ